MTARESGKHVRLYAQEHALIPTCQTFLVARSVLVLKVAYQRDAGEIDVLKNSDLHKALQRLDVSISKISTAKALQLLDEEIANPENLAYRPHFQVHKAGVLWARGQTGEALRLLKECALDHNEIDSVHYFAGEYLLEVGEFEEAIRYLSRCLEIAESSGDGWYQDSACLLRAYCAAKVGKFDMVRQDLEKIDDDDPMIWLKAKPIVSKNSIKQMLEEYRL